MTNLLEEAINCDDGDRAAKIIQDALDIESDDVAITTASQRRGLLIVRCVLGSSATGCRREAHLLS